MAIIKQLDNVPSQEAKKHRPDREDKNNLIFFACSKLKIILIFKSCFIFILIQNENHLFSLIFFCVIYLYQLKKKIIYIYIYKFNKYTQEFVSR